MARQMMLQAELLWKSDWPSVVARRAGGYATIRGMAAEHIAQNSTYETNTRYEPSVPVCGKRPSAF